MLSAKVDDMDEETKRFKKVNAKRREREESERRKEEQR